MGGATGAAEAHAKMGVLAWRTAAGAGQSAFATIHEAGFAIQIVEQLDDLITHLGRDPDALVLLDAAHSLDDALAACRRIRALPGSARITVCLTSAERGARDEAQAIEAGADAVWDASVRSEVVRALMTRAERAWHAGRRELPIATKRSGRVRSAGSLAERRFRALLDNVPDMVAVIDASGVIQMVNPAVRTLLGRSPDALGGTSLWELLHPDDVTLARQMLDEALTTDGVASPTTLRAHHGDGSSVTVEITGQSLLDDPAIAGVLIYVRDVSERMWVGAALQESERRFSEIFENMLEGVVQIDEGSRSLIQANSAFCRLVGCSRQDIYGLMLVDFFPVEDRSTMDVVLDEHFTGKRRVSDGLRIQHRNGTVRWVDIGTSRVELSELTTMIAVVRDVTARRATERSREMFIAVVAHELRTPVAIVRNSVELLQSKQETMPREDRITLLNVLREEAERLTRLVGDALDVGAIQTGSLALRPHRVDLATIVASVAARIGPQFQTSANVYLEKTDAHVDPLRFEQVLSNLLENAWRHCGATTKVDVTLGTEGGFARVSVQDDGPGFPPELRDDVLVRVLVPNGRPTSGIGIGLWLCRGLVESMGGALTVDPGGNGRGACVTFTVPLPQETSA